MMKKKITSLFLALVLAAAMTGCSSPDNNSSPSSQASSSAENSSVSSAVSSTPGAPAEDSSQPPPESAASGEKIRVAALKGPTAMGLVKLMDDNDHSEAPQYDFSIYASPDEITPKLVQGELDLAAVPANLASVLYNKTEGKIQVLAVNTLGVLYIVESGDSVNTVEDLRGRTIFASGKGSTPEYALNYMLSQNGIDPEKDVSIEWRSEHSECVAALASTENAVAMLPQPFATTALTKNENIRIALDMTKEWENLAQDNGSPTTLITGVAVARTDFVQQNPEAVKKFLEEYSSSVTYVTEQNDAAAELVGNYDIVTAEVAKKALPQCNITFLSGSDMKDKLSSYLSVLFEQNPQAVGGKLPADDFYYAG